MTKTMIRVLCLLAAATMAACSQPASVGVASAMTRIVPATIYVTSYLGGCVAAAVPYRLQVKKNEYVEWSIVDFCGATQGYTKDFELKWAAVGGVACSDGTQNPLDGPAKGKMHVRTGTNSNCADGKVFKYEIWVDGTKLADPELELGQ